MSRPIPTMIWMGSAMRLRLRGTEKSYADKRQCFVRSYENRTRKDASAETIVVNRPLVFSILDFPDNRIDFREIISMSYDQLCLLHSRLLKPAS